MRTLAKAMPLLLGSLLLAPTTRALELGDSAPPLAIEQWIKGDAVDLQEDPGNQIYVIEFWATWCPPCRVSIPHLTKTQATFKEEGVVVIGISDEPAAKVEPFVKKMGDNMAYTVALDADGKTSRRYLAAFGVRGIPHAFVIDRDGKLVWHGHPMAELDAALEQIVKGTYDLKGARFKQELETRREAFFQQAMQPEPGDQLADLGRQIVKDAGDDIEFINEFAWRLLTDKRLRLPNLDLAMEAARTAYDAGHGENADVADTYARAWYESGNLDKAIELEREAIALKPKQNYFHKVLQKYVGKTMTGESDNRHVTWEPATLTPGDELTVRYAAMGSPLEEASDVYLHAGFNRWDPGETIHEPMTRSETGVWTYTLAVPAGTKQVDFIFASGPYQQRSTKWDSDEGLEWHVPVR